MTKGLGASFRATDDAAVQDLRDRFVFDPDQADIRLGKRRMLLVDDLGLGLMRQELIQALGFERARGVFSRIGYGIGVTDARFAQDVRGHGDLIDVYRAGPQLHALKGAVRVEELAFEADFEAGHFHGEYLWHNSAECLSHLDRHGIGTQPAGWQQLGYASGYASTFFGRPMVFRELECVAMGHPRCYLVGKPANEWPDAEAELRWFRAETYSRRPSSAAPGHPRHTADHDLQMGARSIVGASSQFNAVLHLVDKVAPTLAPVLFLGESGVGKEVFARELHKRSRRADQPMVALNCAAIPDTLIEAELFGVERGAYTGASASRPGRFERASGGTLFLDEIGTLSLAAQSKLLRVLQDGEVERVGGTRAIKVDVRLVAATNANLAQDLEKGTFRLDLFHRLGTFPIHIPPLRERPADIPVLANYFLQRLSARHGRSGMRFDADVVRCFHDYDWPGNVREMENLIERGIILVEDDEPITTHHLTPGSGSGNQADALPDAFRRFILNRRSGQQQDRPQLGSLLLSSGLTQQDVLDQLISAALDQHDGNASAAALAIGMTRAQVQYWKKTRSGGGGTRSA